MPDSSPLQIVPCAADRALTRDQKRFNTLSRDIAQARATLQAWQERQALYRKAWLEQLAPLQAKLRTVLRQWVLALAKAEEGNDWSRGERAALADLIADAAAELLDAGAPDAILEALLARYGDAQAESGQALDLPEEDADAGPEAGRQEHLPPRRKSAAQLRREAGAQRATQSLREVFRKLASALHPDRETDPVQRVAKTALMAQVNEAYGREDLLALLELQLRIEQIDADHLANVDAVRLKHYNKVLAEQLAELREEIEGAENACRQDFGLEPAAALDPRRLLKEVEGEAARLRKAVAHLRQEAGLFGEPAWLRRWLKAQRP